MRKADTLEKYLLKETKKQGPKRPLFFLLVYEQQIRIGTSQNLTW
jgi:hypothetical protein